MKQEQESIPRLSLSPDEEKVSTRELVLYLLTPRGSHTGSDFLRRPERVPRKKRVPSQHFNEYFNVLSILIFSRVERQPMPAYHIPIVAAPGSIRRTTAGLGCMYVCVYIHIYMFLTLLDLGCHRYASVPPPPPSPQAPREQEGESARAHFLMFSFNICRQAVLDAMTCDV
jgi:hypothetical protein